MRFCKFIQTLAIHETGIGKTLRNPDWADTSAIDNLVNRYAGVTKPP